MTRKLYRGFGIVYGNPPTGTVDVFPSDTGITDNQFQGCNHFDYSGTSGGINTPVNGFPKGCGYDNKKTLLDEFAMAAMAAIAGKVPLCTRDEDKEALARGAYSYAAAMMRERNRRDEMGNVKEATEQ